MLIKLELIGLASFEKWIYPAEQESSVGGDLLPPVAYMFPLLQVLIIKDCCKLLGFPFSNHIVSPDWFPKLQEFEIEDCPKFLSVTPMSWIENLHHVKMEHVKLLDVFEYSKSSNKAELKIIGEGDLHSLDQVLVFYKETCLTKITLERCPPLELKHLLMLTSLKTLFVKYSDSLVGPLGDQGDVEWQLPIEDMHIWELNGNIGEELTELLPHLPNLSTLEIRRCKNIKKLAARVDVQQTTSAASEMEKDEIITAAQEEEDAGVLQFPSHLCDSLRELEFHGCPKLVLVDPATLVPGRGCLQMQSLQRLTIRNFRKLLSAFSFSRHLFPSSLQFLELWGVEGMGTLEPLSNLSSLTILKLFHCGKVLKCQGLLSLVTTRGQLRELSFFGSPGFFAGWDPNPKRALEDVEGGEEQQTQLFPSTLQKLWADDITGLLVAPICSFLSSSLTELKLHELPSSEGMELFSKEQEAALQLLSSLQELQFSSFKDLLQLPTGLRNFTSLRKLAIHSCPTTSSLPNDGLPDSLQELNVRFCRNEELKQQCRGLEGTIPIIMIDGYNEELKQQRRGLEGTIPELIID